MTRSITVAGTAFCAILLVAVQIDMSAQSKAPAKAPAKSAQAKPLPAKAAVVPVEAGSITLTGCLQADGRKYMLIDPEGFALSCASSPIVPPVGPPTRIIAN